MAAIPMAMGALRIMTLGPVAQAGGLVDWWTLIEKGGTIAVLSIFCYLLYLNDQRSRKKFDRQQELIIKALTQSTASQDRMATAAEYCERTNLNNKAHGYADQAHMDAVDARDRLVNADNRRECE